MNIAGNPPLLERLAASYALGTLRGGARRRFEALARESATVRVAALLWRERLGAITELQTSAQPSPNVWKRIEYALHTGRHAVTRQLADAGVLAQLRRALARWRSAAFAGGLATAAAVLVGLNLQHTVEQQHGLLRQASADQERLLAQLRATPEIQYVAVLADDRHAPAMLVTVDTRNQRLILKRVSGFQEATDKSLQLWAVPPAGTPRSLGVLGEGRLLRLTAAERELQAAPALAVSLEPRGGVPGDQGPTGPVLFQGALLQTTL